jgi:spermidine synthase
VWRVLLVFALAIFVSATLLFLVQPMFTKMVLPLLGGAPGVWNTCLVFYQAALLTGYAYAHVAPRYLGVRRQAVFHVALLILIVFTLPIGISHGWTPPLTSNPVLWLLLLLSVSVGLPFFVISTTAPLLQKWFAHTGHAHAHDPYFLYGASNLGSLLALMCYPVLVEPYLRLGHQAWVWAGGYLLLIGLISLCALMLWRSAGAGAGAASELAETLAAAAPFRPAAPPLTLSQRCWWVLLAFAPSSLLLGVTSYISTDIASVPLLWVIPLALYILTFVLVFARRPLLPHRLMLFLEPYLIILAAITFFLPIKGIFLLLPLYLLTFFMIAMVCHGELMKARPPASQLTEFYLWMSVGGVLGGVFNALVAPMVFNSVIEFPLIIVLACLLRPGQASEAGKSNNQLEDYLRPLLFAVTLAGMAWGLKGLPNQWQTLASVLVACLVGAICYSFRLRPRRFALGVGVLILSGLWFQAGSNQVLLRERNFFGVLKVTLSGDGQYHVLHHGTTLHGSQSLDPARRREPLSYYYRLGPLGQVCAAYEGKDAKKKVAIVGLGTGTVACYAQPGQQFTFYEIDPAVERIARDPRYFTFLQDCPAKYEVVLGDARLSLQQAPDSCYDMIILDAFSSDAIPVHLMTREALALYRAKLNKGGILLFHISNRYLDLKPVLGALARDAGWISLCQSDVKMTIKELAEQKKSSSWVVMARDLDDLARLDPGARWQSLSGTTREVLWTDDFSNILAVFKTPGRK